jgi:hypothetical protein
MFDWKLSTSLPVSANLIKAAKVRALWIGKMRLYRRDESAAAPESLPNLKFKFRGLIVEWPSVYLWWQQQQFVVTFDPPPKRFVYGAKLTRISFASRLFRAQRYILRDSLSCCTRSFGTKNTHLLLPPIWLQNPIPLIPHPLRAGALPQSYYNRKSHGAQMFLY